MDRLTSSGRSTIASCVTTLAALAVLCGCSSAPVADSPPPTSSSTGAAAGEPSEAPFATETETDTCVDGFAWMTFHDDDPGEKSLPGGCDTVVVAGSGGTLHSGPARVVVVMGARNHVDVETVTQVDVEGADNEIVHGTDTEPVVNTDGTGNVVTAR